MITPNRHIAAMAPYALADLSVPEGKRLISLAQNESAVPPSPKAIAAGRDAMATAELYPDPDWTGLREAIAQVHDVPADCILCGAGSMELIACLAHCYAGPNRRVLSSQYGYAFFRTAALAAGAAFDQAAEHDRTVSVDTLLAAVRDDTGLVFVANPGNPTGTRIARCELLRLRDGLGRGTLLVIDEAYGEFADGCGEPLFELVSRGDTVVLRTFSKAYGLAGMRVGWGLFPPAIAAEMRKVLNPNNISTVSEAATRAAMADQAYMRATCAETIARRDGFAERMRQLGLLVPDSYTNFVVIGFADSDAAARAGQALRSEGVLLRGLAGYGLSNCLRATIGDEADLDCAAHHIATWCKGEGLT